MPCGCRKPGRLFLMGAVEVEVIMNTHRGSERRHGQRRQVGERRTEIRWEPDKEDRRHGVGRRQSDVAPKFWNDPDRNG